MRALGWAAAAGAAVACMVAALFASVCRSVARPLMEGIKHMEESNGRLRRSSEWREEMLEKAGTDDVDA